MWEHNDQFWFLTLYCVKHSGYPRLSERNSIQTKHTVDLDPRPFDPTLRIGPDLLTVSKPSFRLLEDFITHG